MTPINGLTIGDINSIIMFSFILTFVLVVAYFKYDTSKFFKFIGDIFIKISFVKRNKYDLLLFAIIPFFIGVMFLILRLILAGVI
jgi:hypothetical protein